MVHSSSLDCASVRWSHQISAGRMTSSFSSSRTAPCIWPEKPTQAIDSAGRPEACSALRTAMAAARHQSCGSCSAQPGSALAKLACSSVPEARTAPCSSRMTARVPLVPTSMPRMGMGPPSCVRLAGDSVSSALLRKGKRVSGTMQKQATKAFRERSRWTLKTRGEGLSTRQPRARRKRWSARNAEQQCN